MIGMIGLLGIASVVATVVTVVTTVVSVSVQADAAAKQKDALEKVEDRQQKQHALDKFYQSKKQLRSRRAAATGTLASIIEAKKNKYSTDATYRKLTRMGSTKAVISHARVNRGNYNYGSPVQS